MRPLQIFIGWDSRETIAYQVLCNSLITHASGPISITPLVQSSLRKTGVYWRSADMRASTEFSLTRFLVPYLCGYKGTAIFMDCDMLCQDDLYKIVPDSMEESVACVQHEYTPSTSIKMDGCRQEAYPRKNWSSLMIFNNEQCRILSPEYVNQATPADLHQMRWANDEIRAIPARWNWLVGEYVSHPDASLLHYTLGGPWFAGCPDGPEVQRWWEAYHALTGGVPCIS